MKRKYAVLLFTFSFLLLSGVCYSCTYLDNRMPAPEITSLSPKSSSGENVLVSPDTAQKGSTSSEGQEPESPDTKDNKAAECFIHICGAVKNPGVFRVGEGARLFDLIELAGGLMDNAAADYINQARLVEDGQRVYIPTRDEVKDLNPGEYISGEDEQGNEDTSKPVLVNINKAGTEELMSLPGIGEAKAKNIIDYRKLKGGFKTIEDLMDIPGIKEGLFNQLSSCITVN